MSDTIFSVVPDAAVLQRRERARSTVSRDGMSAAERRIRAALANDPTLTKDQLARSAPCSGSTASKYLRLIDQERQAAAAPAVDAEPITAPPPVVAVRSVSHAQWLAVAAVGTLLAVNLWQSAHHGKHK